MNRHAIVRIGGLAALAVGVGAVRAGDDVPTLDSIRALAIRSPYRISASARAGTIRYRLRVDAREWSWPETAEQHVERDGDDAVLTICADCGREPAPSAAALAGYLAPNDAVRSDDAAVRAFARGVRAGGDVDGRMRALTAAVRRHMTGAIEFRGYGDARQALESRSGDCTETAVLLAAAARARGIAARVAFGVAYSAHSPFGDHVFVPHMWVQAWNGARWISYDAALERFDAGHVALALGDGSTASARAIVPAIARLRIVGMTGIVPERANAGP
ncbi:MAG TPA: transglutaminase domain-containing protein [Dokdonella sp.]